MPKYSTFINHEDKREAILDILPSSSPRKEDFIKKLDDELFPIKYYVMDPTTGFKEYKDPTLPGLSEDKDAWLKEKGFPKKVKNDLKMLRKYHRLLKGHIAEWRDFALKNRPHNLPKEWENYALINPPRDLPFGQWNPEAQISELEKLIRKMEMALFWVTPTGDLGKHDRIRQTVEVVLKTWREFYPDDVPPKTAKQGRFGGKHQYCRPAEVCRIAVEVVTMEYHDISRHYEETVEPIAD